MHLFYHSGRGHPGLLRQQQAREDGQDRRLPHPEQRQGGLRRLRHPQGGLTRELNESNRLLNKTKPKRKEHTAVIVFFTDFDVAFFIRIG